MEHGGDIKGMTKVALMVAVNCVAAYIFVPLPFTLSPISILPLTVNLTGFILTVRQAFFTLTAYILLGLAGRPVLSAGAAGPGYIFGPLGGYYFGFLLTAVTMAYLKKKTYDFRQYALIGVCVGVPLTLLCGAGQLMLLTDIGRVKAFLIGMVTFLPLDAVKAVAAAYLAGPILRYTQSER